MFCDEVIKQVYTGVIEDDDVYSHNAFLDCYHDIAYYCTEGYRIVLETEHYAISLSANGVVKEKREEWQAHKGEWLQDGIEIMDDDESPWVHFETTLFVGERLLSVTKEENIFLVQFDDFLLKVIPCASEKDVRRLDREYAWAYNYVLGCERHIKRRCPRCGGTGEILLDFVCDYVVRCKECKYSTYAGMNAIDAINSWNDGEVRCDLSDIVIE